MHGTVLGSLDGYIIVFLLSLKRVLWSMRESVKVLPLLSFPERSQTPSSLFPAILRCHVRAHAQNRRESDLARVFL